MSFLKNMIKSLIATFTLVVFMVIAVCPVTVVTALAVTTDITENLYMPVTFGGNSVSEDVSGLAFRFIVENIDIDTNGTKALYNNATVTIGDETYKLTDMGVVAHNGDVNAEYGIDDCNGLNIINVPAVYLMDVDSENSTATFAARITQIPEDKRNVQITTIPYVIIEDNGTQKAIYNESQSRSYNEIAAPEEDNTTIPDGGIYTTADGVVLQSGNAFPEKVTNSDSYEFGDYKYVYRINSDGWQVYVKDKTLTEYGEILSEIVNEPVNSLGYTFESCTNMVTAPRIPASIVYMSNTFSCCTSLGGVVYVDANPSSYSKCFYGVNINKQGISVEGEASFTTKNELLLTASNVSLTSGSKYTCGDYTYTYNSTGKNWWVAVTTTDKKEYGEILHHAYGYPVVSLNYTFKNCSLMTKSPELPYTATTMEGTFLYCVSLQSAPQIPEGITTLEFAFQGCEKLKESPLIPNTVLNMCNTFRDCSSLLAAPAIPDSVNKMNCTFRNCTSMTTPPPVIENSVRYYKELFFNCTAMTGTIEMNTDSYNYDLCFFNVDFQAQHLTLTGTSSILDRIGKSAVEYCANCNGYCFE